MSDINKSSSVDIEFQDLDYVVKGECIFQLIKQEPFHQSCYIVNYYKRTFNKIKLRYLRFIDNSTETNWLVTRLDSVSLKNLILKPDKMVTEYYQ